MSLTLEQYGRPIAKIINGHKSVISIVADKQEIRDNDIRVAERYKLPEGNAKFQQVPDTTRERDILYICGPSGSGKSTYVVAYCKEYKKAYPKRPIYVLSSLEEDETLDQVKGLKRIKLDDRMISEPLQPNLFMESLVIADDTDVIGDKKLRDAVIQLINQILEIGRHFKTSLIMTNHLSTAGRDTRRILNEAHSITYFPHSGAVRGIMYLLEEYCGIDKKTAKTIKKLGSRWATVFKNYPMYVMTEHDIFKPDEDD